MPWKRLRGLGGCAVFYSHSIFIHNRMTNEIHEGCAASKSCVYAGGWAVRILALAGALLLVAMFFSELKAYRFIGRDVPGEMTTITVTGNGEAFAVPDMAVINFSVTHEAKTALEARKRVDEDMKEILAFLKENGVAEKDIRTINYNLYPKHEWQESRIVCITYPCPQPPGKQVLIGYEVSQSVEVKIRKIDDAGTIVGGLADKGATGLSGPSFEVDDKDAVKAKARAEAIAKAKEKAKELAKDLDVNLIRIVSFNESGDYPIYYGRSNALTMKTAEGDAEAFMPATLPVGENKFVSNVTIVYEVE